MKAKPIIFSAPMIRALLEGKKSQTRRVLKPQPAHLQVYDWKGKRLHDSEYRHWCWNGNVGADSWDDITVQLGPFLPYAPGQLLWVRETWAEHHPAGIQEGRYSIKGRAGIPGPPGVEYRVIYRADGDPLRVWHCEGYPYRTVKGPRDEIDAKHPEVCSEMPGWTPSIHMPRWASRLTLEVTEVRVQRVQDISEADAEAEGVRGNASGPWGCEGLVEDFADLWNSIHGPDAWDRNPWVAAITFKTHHQNVDQLLAEREAA